MDINKLLNKKGWTGEELGRLEVYNAMYVYGQALQGVPNPKGVVSENEFKKMLDTITDKEEAKIYNGYTAIHGWLSKQVTGALAYQQQAQLHFYTFFNRILCAEMAERTNYYIWQLPFILTEKQYNDILEDVKAPYMTGKKELSLINLVGYAFTDIAGEYISNPRRKNPLKPLKKKLRLEPVTADYIYNGYNEVWGNGYYIMPNGKKSTDITGEEWLEAVKPIINEIDAEAEKGNITYTKCRYIKTYIENCDSLASDYLALYGYKWEYDAMPEKLTKWEILMEDDLIENYYSGLYSEEKGEATQAIKAFKKEFPEVLEAVLEDINKYFKGISSTPFEEWATPAYSWKELYEVGFYSYRLEDFEAPSIMFDENFKARANGIAIYKPIGATSENYIDSNGHYKAPDLTKELKSLLLDSFFTESEYYADNTSSLEDARETLLDSYYYIKAYNLIIDMIQEHFKIDGLEVLKVSTKNLDKRINGLNFAIQELYKEIVNAHYEDREYKEKKLEVIRNFFYKIDIDTLTIPEAKIEQVKEAFKDFRAFKKDDFNPISIMCYREK